MYTIPAPKFPSTLDGMHKVGRGSFSAVYTADHVTVDILTEDYAKECMALFFPESRLFPVVTRLANWGDLCRYRMRYYPSAKCRAVVSQLCDHDAGLYRLLRVVATYHASSYCEDDFARFDRLWELMAALPDEYEAEREDMLYAVQALSNYGPDVGFEVSPRNVATEDGRLVLLDCFFMRSQLQRARRARRGPRVIGIRWH